MAKGESENDKSRDSGSFPRPTQDRSSFAQMLKAQFRAVAKAIIQTLAPSPAQRRKRREETGKAFRLAARRRLIRRPPPRMDYEPPPIFFEKPKTLDWMNSYEPDHDDASAADDEYYQPPPDCPFPQP